LHNADDPDQLIGHDISEFIKPECLPAIKQQIKVRYATGTASAPMEVILITCDGQLVDIEAVAIPISIGQNQTGDLVEVRNLPQ
jgi:hypothetical protein